MTPVRMRAVALWQQIRALRPLRAYSHFTDVGGPVLAAGMSYQALFAVFAGIWVGFGVLGAALRGSPQLLESIVDQINSFIPGLLGENGVVTVNELLGGESGQVLSWTSLIAGGTLLWVAVAWFTGTRRSIRIVFELEVKEYRNAVLLKLRDFLLAVIFFVAIVVSAALTLLSTHWGELIITWLGLDPNNWLVSGMGAAARYGALLVFDVALLLAMHRLLAEIALPFWVLLRGCALGGLALLALKMLGGSLLGGSTSNPLLTTFAVFVGLLLWFNLICRVVLLTSAWVATGVDRELGRAAAHD